MPKRGADKTPEGFTPEEWQSWQSFIKDARQLSVAIKCDYETALLLLALNEIAVKLDRGPDKDDDEPWKGKR